MRRPMRLSIRGWLSGDLTVLHCSYCTSFPSLPHYLLGERHTSHTCPRYRFAFDAPTLVWILFIGRNLHR